MSEKRFNQDSTLYENVIGNVTGNLTGNVTGNVVGNVTGNLAGTADYATTAINATNATYASQVAIVDNTLTVTATPAGGTFTISGAAAHSYNITDGAVILKLVTIHFVCATSTGGAGANFPLVIGFSGDSALNYTEVLCNVSTSTTSRTLSGVIGVGASDITIADSNGLNPAAGQNWSIIFYYLV